jgi:hypothetical protein
MDYDERVCGKVRNLLCMRKKAKVRLLRVSIPPSTLIIFDDFIKAQTKQLQTEAAVSVEEA